MPRPIQSENDVPTFRWSGDHRKNQCERFERRYRQYLGAKHVYMTSSGTSELTAAMVGLKIGPGQEVIVPAHTYMAPAVAVLAIGAIPVIVDIDDSITQRMDSGPAKARDPRCSTRPVSLAAEQRLPDKTQRRHAAQVAEHSQPLGDDCDQA